MTRTYRLVNAAGSSLQWRWIRRAVRRVAPRIAEGTWDRRLAGTADVVIVSHPKVGTTWVRYMLGRYTTTIFGLTKLPTFDAADVWLRSARLPGGPAVHITHGGLRWADQTADDLDRQTIVDPYAKRRVVVLVRHPLDALVSNYHYRTRRARRRFDGDIASFLTDPVWGVDKFVRHYNLWADERRRRPDEVHVWRYEDAHRDPETTLRALVDFCGLAIDDQAIVAAVRASDFEAMQQLELQRDAPVYASTGTSMFSPSDDPDARKVRRGLVGGWRRELEAELGQQLERRVAETLDPLYGYG